jgi:c-di-GMP-binding flagellar brake protein YcgR
MTPEETSRRSAPRKPIRCEARLAFSDAPPVRAKTKDIASGGLSVMAVEQLATGRTCMVTFEAPLNGKMVQVTGVAKVIYSILSGTEGFRTGLQFIQLDAANARTLHELMA